MKYNFLFNYLIFYFKKVSENFVVFYYDSKIIIIVLAYTIINKLV